MKILLITISLLITSSLFAKVNISGFGTAGFSVTDSNDALLMYKTGSKLDFQRLSKFGLNFSDQLNKRFSFAAQVVAKDRVNSEENFTLKEDWAFLKFQASQNISFRFGRLRLPIWLFSDYLDVGYLKPWTESPVEVYSQSPFNTGDGVTAQHTLDLKSFELKSEIFFTNSNFTKEFSSTTYGTGKAEDFTVFNIEAIFDSFLLKTTHAYSNKVLGSTIIKNQVPGKDSNIKIPIDTKYKFTNIALKIEKNGWEIYSEYAHSEVVADDQEQLFKAQYLTVGRHINDLFIYFGYNTYFWDFKKEYITGTITTPVFDSTQNSIHFGTNYTISTNTIFKIQLSKYSVDESDTYGINSGSPNGYDLSTGTFNENTGEDIQVINATLDFIF